MNRRRPPGRRIRCRVDRARTAWWMVGTAVYQVGSKASSHPKNDGATKPGVATMLPPEAIVARTAATRPWMWNRGMTLRQRSASVSSRAAAIVRAEATSRPCVSGTIFGRAVVPDVCRTRAMSSALGPSILSVGSAPAATSSMVGERSDPGPRGRRRIVPAGASSWVSSKTGIPSASATSAAGVSSATSTTTALIAWRSVRSNSSSSRRYAGLSGATVATAAIAEEGGHRMRPVRSHQGHAVDGRDPRRLQLGAYPCDHLAKPRVGQRRAVRREQRDPVRRSRRLLGDERADRAGRRDRLVRERGHA